jgi:glycosidase
MLAEADDPALLQRAFEIDYAWDFYHSVSEAIAGQVPVSQVRAAWDKAAAMYPRGALHLRFSDNHDQLRATGQFGLPAALAASALMYTLDGVPLLYNGMEVGDNTESAAPALFERCPLSGTWPNAARRWPPTTGRSPSCGMTILYSHVVRCGGSPTTMSGAS